MVKKILFNLVFIIGVCTKITFAQPSPEQDSNFKNLKRQAKIYFETGEYKKCYEAYNKALVYARSDKECKDGYNECKKKHEEEEITRLTKERDKADSLDTIKADSLNKIKQAEIARLASAEGEKHTPTPVSIPVKTANEKKVFFRPSLLDSHFELISIGYSLNYLQNNTINKDLNGFGSGIFLEFYKSQTLVGNSKNWCFLWHLYDRNLPTIHNDLRVATFGFIQPHIGPSFSINHLNIYMGAGLKNRIVRVSEDSGKWLKRNPSYNYSLPNKSLAIYNNAFILNPSIILKIDNVFEGSKNNFGVTFNYLFKSIKPIKTNFFSNIPTFTFSFQYGLNN